MLKTKKFKFKKNQGFSLMEIMISLSIFVLISILVFGWQKDIFSISNLFNKRLISQENIRRVIKDFTAQVRTAQPSNLGAYILEQANKDTITFYSDLDNDGLKERVRYFFDGSNLKRGIIKPSGNPLTYNPINEKLVILVTNLINQNNEIFNYFDKNYDGDDLPLTQPLNITDVRLIKITLVVDEDLNRPPTAIAETSQVSIRNLKDNL